MSSSAPSPDGDLGSTFRATGTFGEIRSEMSITAFSTSRIPGADDTITAATGGSGRHASPRFASSTEHDDTSADQTVRAPTTSSGPSNADRRPTLPGAPHSPPNETTPAASARSGSAAHHSGSSGGDGGSHAAGDERSPQSPHGGSNSGDDAATDAAAVDRVPQHDPADRGDGSGSDEDSDYDAADLDGGTDAASDRRAAEYQRRFDQLRLQREVERLEGVAGQLKERERLLKTFYSDVTLPVTDEVGITLGQIRTLAMELGSPQMDGLVDRLETAIEDQMLTLLTHLRGGSNEALVAGTAFERRLAKREAKRADRKRAIEEATEAHVSPEEAEGMLRIAAVANARHGGTPHHTRMSPVTTIQRRAAAAAASRHQSHLTSPTDNASPSPRGIVTLGESNGDTAASFPGSVGPMASSSMRSGTGRSAGRPAVPSRASFSGVPYVGSSAVPIHPSASFAASAAGGGLTASEYLGGGFGAEDLVGATPYLVAEAVAKSVRCERVRVYLANDDGLGVRHVTSFPTEPTTTLPPALPRSLLTSVFHRGLAVAGYQQTREPLASASLKDLKGASARVMQQMAAKQKAAAAATQAGLPRCTLVFPIVAWCEGKKRIAGVIECLDKEPGDDEATIPGEEMGSNTSVTSSAKGKRFTSRDELLVFTATQLLGALLERYPAPLFTADLGPSLHGLNSAAAANGHLPALVTGDIPAAAQVGNRSLRAAPAVDIFRGPMTSVHRFAANKEDAKREALNGTGAQAGGASGSSDIRNVEESLDSLNAMWRKAYEDNVQMHRQCRNMSERMSEMRRVTARFEDVLSTARELRSLEDVHDYLRLAELSLKGGKAGEVDRAIDAGIATAERARAIIDAAAAEGAGQVDDEGGEDDDDAAAVAEIGDAERPSSTQTTVVGDTARRGGHEPRPPSQHPPSRLGDHLPTAAASRSSRPPTAPGAVVTVPPSWRGGDGHQQQQQRRRVPTAAAARRTVPIAELHYEGPAGVRPYTVDPVTKRDQFKAIEAMIAREEGAVHEAERRRLAAIPGYARGTVAAVQRAEATPFDLPPDPAEIEARLRAQRVLANETVAGVPLHSGAGGGGGKITAAMQAHSSTARASRPGTGGGVGGKRLVSLTGATPFRMGGGGSGGGAPSTPRK